MSGRNRQHHQSASAVRPGTARRARPRPRPLRALADQHVSRRVAGHGADRTGGLFDGAIDGESFRAYIEQILVPTLQPGDIVIADTLGAHKVAGIQRAIQAAGATLWYLPPYSPDLNPIELCFAKLKALVRTARCRSTETLWPFLGECLAHSGPDECRTYFRHCGTRPPHGHEKRFRSVRETQAHAPERARVG